MPFMVSINSKLNQNNLRKKKFSYFLDNLNNEKYYVNFNVKGSCNYAFIVLFNNNIEI